MSIPIYALAGFDAAPAQQRIGDQILPDRSFASAILLYGVALLYGVSAPRRSRDRAAFDPRTARARRLAFVVVGFAFKISSCRSTSGRRRLRGRAGRRHRVHERDVKLAAFAAFLRVLTLSFEPLASTRERALGARRGDARGRQRDGGDPGNIKRLLATRASRTPATADRFVPAPPRLLRCVLPDRLLFMNLGAFAVVVALANRGQNASR